MAAPTTAELQALIATLQNQVAALTSAAPTTSTTAAPMPAVVIFADTPQSLNVEDLLDYLTKRYDILVYQDSADNSRCWS